VEEEKLAYDYTIAASVSEAKSRISSENFDIVVTDYSLGDGTAFDILGLVKNMPVIVVTGAGDEKIAIKAWRAGAYDYIVKDAERSYLRTVPITVENALSHKKAEEKLRLLSAAITSTGDSIYVTDMDDKIVFVNKAFCATYGYKQEDVLGKISNILWIGKLESVNTRSVFRTRSIKGTLEVGFYHKRKDGSIFPVSLSRSVIKDSHGSQVGIVATSRDITERVLVEEALRKANLELKQQNQLKSEFAIRVSEVLSKVLNDEIIKAESQQGDISKALNKARSIVNDLLQIAKIDAGQIQLNSTEHSLVDLVVEVVQAISPSAEKKNVKISNFVSDKELTVNGDPSGIRQVLNNLVGYLVSSSCANSHVEIRATDIGSDITLEVRSGNLSTGAIKPEKLFDRNAWTKEKPDTLSVDNWPLGLVVVKELVEMHSGRLWIEDLGTGAVSFCFSVPKPGVSEVIAAGKANNYYVGT